MYLPRWIFLLAADRFCTGIRCCFYHCSRFLFAGAGIFTARLNRLAPVPPPLLMTNSCELLRMALLSDQSEREAVFADAAAAGAALADEMHKQRHLLSMGSSRLSVAEQQQQASVLTELEAQPRYTALLRISGLRAANVVPVGGWQVGERIDLCVVARALGPEVDPESAVVASAPAGAAVWSSSPWLAASSCASCSRLSDRCIE